MPQNSKNGIYFDVRLLEMAQKRISKLSESLFRPYCETFALRLNSFSLQDVLTTESIDIENTGMASVVCPLLISVTFRAVLNQCAVGGEVKGPLG